MGVSKERLRAHIFANRTGKAKDAGAFSTRLDRAVDLAGDPLGLGLGDAADLSHFGFSGAFFSLWKLEKVRLVGMGNPLLDP